MQFLIQGGQKLNGSIRINGMKNAATPIIAATLLVKGDCILNNMPRISDVEKLLGIIQALGGQVSWTGQHQVTINTNNVQENLLDEKAVKSMRSSILLMGPLLSRFKNIKIPEPGGCIIGNRPVDTHLQVMKALGAEVQRSNGHYIISTTGLRGSKIVLQEFSVTGTENAVMAACLADGITFLHTAAVEPHVMDLVKFLNSCGANIKEKGSHILAIDGVSELHGCTHDIIPDQLEVGTFAVAAALTHGQVVLENICPEHLDLILLKLKQISVKYELGSDSLKIHSTYPLKAFKLQTMPYPGFPTDLQQVFGVLATQCSGTTLIHDTMFEGRMGYINELIKMGANAVICDPHRVLITGPTPLYASEIKSFDLRAGATMIIAGLIAQGQTIINDADIVYRGYEKIDERLNALGAKIEIKS